MMQRAIIHAQIYTGETKYEDGYIRYTTRIEELGHMNEYNPRENERIYDAKQNIIIPGMIDIHIHGGYGIDIMDGKTDEILKLSKELLNEGVTTFFPTTMTQSKDEISRALCAVKEAKDRGAHIAYVHLEGPFISKKRAGAQPLANIIKPNVKQLHTWYIHSGNLIKLVTYAPEEGSKELENYFQEHNIIGSVGHSDATFADLVHTKVYHATHVFNQMRGMYHREPGVVGRVLLDKETMIEIIADGVHVHPEMVRLAYVMKGPSKIALITDAMMAKGLGTGNYRLGGQPVVVKNGAATLENGTLAGSVLTMDQAFRNIMFFTGCKIEEAVTMTSVNQAKEFGLHNKGTLKIGKDADFVILTHHLNVKDTVRLGVHKSEIGSN